MGATILRQWLVLTMLPRPPRRIDTGSIASRLRDRGFEVHRRTIQRDLLELAEVFPIVADERAKPYGWRWSDDAQRMEVPVPLAEGMSPRIDVSLRVERSTLPELLESLGARHPRVIETASNQRTVTVIVALEDSRPARRRLLGHA